MNLQVLLLYLLVLNAFIFGFLVLKLFSYRAALRFYADGQHCVLTDRDQHGELDWESVSGEPGNWQFPPSVFIPSSDGFKPYDPPWMVEDGSIAAMALAGKRVAEHG
jgi:hypothetical protein